MLTHGVGPMRTYSLGAILLDLDEPHRVLAHVAGADPHRPAERAATATSRTSSTRAAGSAVGDVLVLPYGVADQSIAIATLSIEQLVASMRITSTRAVSRAANEGYEPV